MLHSSARRLLVAKAGYWRSSDRLWVLPEASEIKVEIIAPFGGGEAMLADLKTKVFPQRELKVLAMKDGKREVRVV